jgi:Raf kinase inhibitor-like YbhB/YbcL family protein
VRGRRTILVRKWAFARIFVAAAIGVAAAGVFLFYFNSESKAIDSAGLRKGAAMGFALESPQFKEGSDIPRQLTCDGEDFSPVLRWDGAPTGTKSFSLVTEDPDAPMGTFIHWVIYDLPENTSDLAQNLPKQKELPNGARQGLNDFGRVGYGGPCPPRGSAHRYYFRLYALDTKLGLAAGASRSELDRAMKGHILAQAALMGRYKRQ